MRTPLSDIVTERPAPGTVLVTVSGTKAVLANDYLTRHFNPNLRVAAPVPVVLVGVGSGAIWTYDSWDDASLFWKLSETGC